METTFNRLKEDCSKKDTDSLSFIDPRNSFYPWNSPWESQHRNFTKLQNDDKSIDDEHDEKVEEDESDVKRVSSDQFSSGY